MAPTEYLLAAVVLLSGAVCVFGAGPIRIENEKIALEFDSDTGAWIGLMDKAGGDNLVVTPAAGVPEGLPGSTEAVPAVSLVSHRLSENGRTLTMTLRRGPWLVHAKHDLYPEGIGSRQFTLENAGDQPLVLRGARHVMPALLPGDEAAAIFPDSLPVGDLPIGRMALGEVMHPKSHDGLVYLWSEKAHRGVGMWFFTEDEYARASVMSAARGTVVRHNPAVLAPVKPGEKVVLGRQFFWLGGGSRDDLLRSIQQIYKIIDLHAPTTSLENLCEKVLYCGHPGGPPELGYRTYGGFKALEAYVPTLRKMGVDLLWLLPIFEHGDGVKWNLYSPFDHFKISPLYGTPEDLKSLSAAAAKAGISLMFDLVPHGPPDVSPLAKAHPEWVCLDEAGKPTYIWGQLAFDDALPAWQDYMRRVAEFNVSEYGIVGVRVDVASGSPPNWNPATGYRPSHSSLGGGLGMIHAIREGLLKASPRTILLPEDYTGLNVFYRDGDLTYDAQLFSLFIELQEQKALPSDWAARLQQFLHDQSLTLPPGALKMRWISNHDTVSWTYQRMRPRAAYGEERTKALLALCSLIDGAPMIYQGDEDPAVYGGKGESIVDFIADLVACRKRTAPLARGQADYDAVRATGGVFACLRSQDEERAVVLVSFNPEAVKSELALPPTLRSVRAWKDELTGESVDAAAVPMAGHQARVLTPVR